MTQSRWMTGVFLFAVWSFFVLLFWRYWVEFLGLPPPMHRKMAHMALLLWVFLPFIPNRWWTGLSKTRLLLAVGLLGFFVMVLSYLPIDVPFGRWDLSREITDGSIFSVSLFYFAMVLGLFLIPHAPQIRGPILWRTAWARISKFVFLCSFLVVFQALNFATAFTALHFAGWGPQSPPNPESNLERRLDEMVDEMLTTSVAQAHSTPRQLEDLRLQLKLQALETLERAYLRDRLIVDFL